MPKKCDFCGQCVPSMAVHLQMNKKCKHYRNLDYIGKLTLCHKVTVKLKKMKISKEVSEELGVGNHYKSQRIKKSRVYNNRLFWLEKNLEKPDYCTSESHRKVHDLWFKCMPKELMGQEENKICHICRKPNGYFPKINPSNDKCEFSDSVYNIKSEATDFGDTKHFLSDSSDTKCFVSDTNDLFSDTNKLSSANMSTEASHKHQIFGDLVEPSNVKLEPRDDFSSEDSPTFIASDETGTSSIIVKQECEAFQNIVKVEPVFYE
eukprot:TRINITY_DN21033_c0_g1_i5.p1 TRINITY_DN21033_c0_g1~~TRINITY_DN21033_c0_g1_i5.p1  ORF type:complete len:263 (+),score=20.24 TRINITY_DN21033_c0_g1_i5:81-869(+)